jgi:3D (Asp-Asp-Asp) domain-containing protein
MKIKKKRITGIITLMILTFFFFAYQDVHESTPQINFLKDKLLETVDSLQKELTAYKEREFIFLRHIGHEECIATAYLPIDSKEGRHSGLTVTGVVAKPYFTVAVDPAVVPINSWIWIDSLGWWKAEDTGNTVTGKKIDLCLFTREEALEFGVRKIRIKILK